MKGPPRARHRYPGMYASKDTRVAKMKRVHPQVMNMLPMILDIRGPYRSRMVPTGKATTFVTTAAIVNMRLSLFRIRDSSCLIWGCTYLNSCS